MVWIEGRPAGRGGSLEEEAVDDDGIVTVCVVVDADADFSAVEIWREEKSSKSMGWV